MNDSWDKAAKTLRRGLRRGAVGEWRPDPKLLAQAFKEYRLAIALDMEQERTGCSREEAEKRLTSGPYGSRREDYRESEISG